MKKIYLNTLTPEEVIRRLKNGKIIYMDKNNTTLKMVDGVIVKKYGNIIIYNEIFTVDNINDYHFKEEESFEISETGLYKTRDGRKAFVFKIDKDVDDAYPVNYIIKNEDYTLSASKQGRNVADHETAMDIIAKWEE